VDDLTVGTVVHVTYEAAHGILVAHILTSRVPTRNGQGCCFIRYRLPYVLFERLQNRTNASQA